MQRQPTRRLTAEQYAALPEEQHYRTELVRGRIVREPFPAMPHASMCVRLGRFLDEFVDRHALGRVFAEVGVITERMPDTVRGPDLSFLSNERIPRYPEEGFVPAAPDLCIEVLSPSNRAGEIKQKVLEYFAGGARLVWIVDTKRKQARVYRSPTDIRILGINDALVGENVLPGFSLPLARLFTP